MENKEDWKELEKWSKKQEEKNISSFGIDLAKVNMQKETKKMHIFTKFTDSAYQFLKYVFFAIVIFVCSLGLWFAYTQIKDFDRSVNIGNVEEKNMNRR